MPITSDLDGYQAFWRHWLIVFAILNGVGWIVTIVLLALIWRK